MDWLGRFATALSLLIFALCGGYQFGYKMGWRDGFYEGSTKAGWEWRDLTREPKHARMDSTGGTESDASSG